jgi:uncharacterized membrane protein
MKPSTFWRYVLLPLIVFVAGSKAGVEYAKRHYVSKDRKFIEGKVVEKSSMEEK